jgi:hypothetical protein
VRRRAARVALAAGLALVTATADGRPAQCSGEGCRFIRLERLADGCVALRNVGSRRSRIAHRVPGVTAGVVEAGSTLTLVGADGECLRRFTSPYTATLGEQEPRQEGEPGTTTPRP